MAEVEVGQIIHLSDVALPSGVESVALSHGEDHDLSIASVLAPKGGSDGEDEEAAAEAPAEEAASDESAEGEGDSEE